MQKAIELAERIKKEPEKNWLPELEAINLHTIFRPIYKLNHNLKTLSNIVAFIFYAYDKDSPWLNLKKDRAEDKYKIFKGLDAENDVSVFAEIIENQNEEVNEVITEYLIDQTDWRWRHIVTQLEYHSNMMRFVSQKTETEKQMDKMNRDGEKKTLVQDYDMDVITKVNKEKGFILDAALKARREADNLLAEIRKDFVQLDNAVQQDFAFEMTDEKKIRPEMWRDFIKQRNKRLKAELE